MLIKVKVHPSSKKEEIADLGESSFEVWLKEKPVNNLANKRLLEVMKSHFGAKRVNILRGHRWRNKVEETKQYTQ